jgi:hypothetical protein
MEQQSRGSILDVLRNLPRDVHGAYSDAMERIKLQNQGDAELARKVLLWVVHARVLLSPEDLLYALAISPGMTSLNTDYLVDDWLSTCAGLVVIDEELNVVRLVREYGFPEELAASCS